MDLEAVLWRRYDECTHVVLDSDCHTISWTISAACLRLFPVFFTLPWRAARLHPGVDHPLGSEGRSFENHGSKSWVAPRECQEHSHLEQREKGRAEQQHLCLFLGSFQMSSFLFVSLASVFCPFPTLCVSSAFHVPWPHLLYYSKGQWPLRCRSLSILVLCCLRSQFPFSFRQNLMEHVYKQEMQKKISFAFLL